MAAPALVTRCPMTATLSPDQFLDPVWRLNNLYTCVSKAGKLIHFRPNGVQQEIIANVHSRNVLLKARQFGVTTLWCLIILDDCLFTPHVRGAVIAHKMDDAKVIFRDKVRQPYDNLDEGLRRAIPATQDSADTLSFGNGSSFRVSTSVRSSTVNWLLVSEYGKICSQWPEKAEEIRSGAFPAAEKGIIAIESTAEGEGGDFYDTVSNARELMIRNAELTEKDYRFFFFPWYRAPEYEMARTNVPVGDDDNAYFDKIESEIGVTISQQKRNWYVTEERVQGGNMKREYPSTPDEAFEQALEGAIYADHLAYAYKHNHIGAFPLDNRFPVNTFWDIGHSHGNATAVLFEQDIEGFPRFVGCYEKEGEWIDQHLRNLKAWGDEHGVTWGKHYMPWDADREEVWLPEGTLSVMGRLGFHPSIVRRTVNIWESIQVARRRFPQTRWDAEGCKLALTRIKRYRKEWDERRGVWRDHPYHGPESNMSDAYRTFAESGHVVGKAPRLDVDDAHKKRFYDRDRGEGSWVAQ